MTAVVGFPTANPDYQRAMRRIANLPPHKRAILRSLFGDVNRQFGAAAMQDYVHRLGLANQADYNKQRMAYDDWRFRQEYQLGQQQRDIAADQRRWGKYMGIASIPIATGLGIANLYERNRNAQLLNLQRAAILRRYGEQPLYGGRRY